MELARLRLPKYCCPRAATCLRLTNRRERRWTPALFHPDEAEARLRGHFKVASLEGYGLRGLPLATAAAGAVLAYLADNQRPRWQTSKTWSVYNPSRYMVLDPSARRHLELFARRARGAADAVA